MMPTKGAGADFMAIRGARPRFLMRRRCLNLSLRLLPVCVEAGTRRDLAIRCGEEFYPDRGVREVDIDRQANDQSGL